MMSLTEKKNVLRIFLGEHTRYQHKPAHLQILELLHKEKIARAMVLRCVAGFVANGRIHNSAILDISNDLPLVIEAVDTEPAIRSILPKLDPMITEALVTLESIEVVHYRPKL